MSTIHSTNSGFSGVHKRRRGSDSSGNDRPRKLEQKVAPRQNVNRVRIRMGFRVRSVRFVNNIDIWYARVPDPAGVNVGWLETRPNNWGGLPLAPGRVINPAQVFPPNWPHPHWERSVHPNAPLSWPVAFERDAGVVPAAGARQMWVRFECVTHPHFNGVQRMYANSLDVPGLTTNEVVVNFHHGVGYGLFTLHGCPQTVARHAGAFLRWHRRHLAHHVWNFFDLTRHTMFFVLTTPRVMQAALVGERPYFELFDWSCRWANNCNTPGATVNAIWGEFTPVKVAHDTGLVYWRGNLIGVNPAQDVGSAIRSFSAIGMQQYAASCKVFDRVFANCLALHGVRSSEMELGAEPRFPGLAAHALAINLNPAYAMQVLLALLGGAPVPDATGHSTIAWLVTGVNRGPLRAMLSPAYKFAMAHVGLTEFIKPSGWGIANRAGHGNVLAPTRWNNHWISAVFVNGGWVLYDPSYGTTMAWNDPAPVLGLVPPAAYEAGVTMHLVRVNDGAAFPAVPSQNPHWPRLHATKLFIN
jgi:hypothetical protein